MGMAPMKAAACGAVSVSVTTSPPGSEVEATRTVTVSTTESLLLGPQSTTLIEALALHGKRAPIEAEPVCEQLTRYGVAAMEKTWGPWGTVVPRTSTIQPPGSGLFTSTCSMLLRWSSWFWTAGADGLARP